MDPVTAQLMIALSPLCMTVPPSARIATQEWGTRFGQANALTEYDACTLCIAGYTAVAVLAVAASCSMAFSRIAAVDW